jgi:hypothetical protein
MCTVHILRLPLLSWPCRLGGANPKYLTPSEVLLICLLTALPPSPPGLAPCRLGGTNPKYLTPSEVREILRRMWDLNEPILAFIYPTGAQCRAPLEE